MKTYLPIFVALTLLALGACTEIEYREIEKEVLKRDTVTKYVDRYFVGVDSTKIPVVVDIPVSVPTRQQDSIVYVIEIQKDTLWLTRVDTLWRERIVYEYDTIVVTRWQYDTLWRSSTRLVHYIPSEVLHIVQQFYADAEAHGKAIKTHYVDIRFKHLDAVEQARSYQVDDQWKLFVNDNLTFSEMYLPIYREMARIQFGKEYSQDPSSVLYPFFNAHTIRWDNRAQFQTEVNQFFE